MRWLSKIGLLNLLLVMLPVALVLEWTDAPAVWVFVCSSVAIIPLAGLMGRSIEMLADRLGAGLGGLLNATFGNAAEVIIALFALHRGMVDVVKASITGSILGNVLLVGAIEATRTQFGVTEVFVGVIVIAIAFLNLPPEPALEQMGQQARLLAAT